MYTLAIERWHLTSSKTFSRYAHSARARFKGVSGMEERSQDLHTEHLHITRENWLRSEEAIAVLNGSKIATQSMCSIAGKRWHQAIYSDFSGERNFVVFEIRRKKFIWGVHHCLGCEILNGTYVPLSKEDLWKEGIP